MSYKEVRENSFIATLLIVMESILLYFNAVLYLNSYKIDMFLNAYRILNKRKFLEVLGRMFSV